MPENFKSSQTRFQFDSDYFIFRWSRYDTMYFDHSRLEAGYINVASLHASTRK